MKQIKARLISVHAGDNENMSKPMFDAIIVEPDGFPGDRHRGFTREAADWDPEPTGTIKRNERQWSGVSIEELNSIRRNMQLNEKLSPETLGANICIEGIPAFSLLPKGSRLVFPSGAVLTVEEENPPCLDMGLEIERRYTTLSGEPVEGKLFPKQALHLRGVVGYVDIAGEINAGDEIQVQVHEAPKWPGSND